jgi:hypothetical protein
MHDPYRFDRGPNQPQKARADLLSAISAQDFTDPWRPLNQPKSLKTAKKMTDCTISR